MPELNLPPQHLVVGRDHYADRAKAWTSVRSAVITATTTATNIRTLLQAEENAYTDAAVAPTPLPDGAAVSFKGEIALTDHTEIEDGSVTLTATVGSAPVNITDSGGVLSGTNVTGTIDYETGAWVVTWSTGAPDDASVMVVDYTEFFNFAVGDIKGLWFYPEAGVRATFDGVTEPTAGTGILISEAIFLTGQSGLIGNMMIYGGAVAVNVEVMV